VFTVKYLLQKIINSLFYVRNDIIWKIAKEDHGVLFVGAACVEPAFTFKDNEKIQVSAKSSK
jgi:hypothetical protein